MPQPDSTQGVVEAFAPAKINLTLHVTGQRPDGYHLLDSLVVFADVGDVVRVRPAKSMSINVTGPMSEGVPKDSTNLVWQAAKWFGTPPVEIELFKFLPPASGIGGGSSDAAATLRALSHLFDKPLPSHEEAAELGADVPVCLRPRSYWMQGIGEELSDGPTLPDYLGMVLVNPKVEVSTPTIFSNLSTKSNPAHAQFPAAFETHETLGDWLGSHRNDLETPAIELAPEIADVLRVLEAEEPICARMSGSGATCFGIFSLVEAKAVGGLLKEKHPEWWVEWCSILGDPFGRVRLPTSGVTQV